MGSVGLIIKCDRGASLRGVCHTDAGSSYNATTGLRNLGNCVAANVLSCTSSIIQRIGHNEWIVGDFRVAGLFMDGSLDVWDTSNAFQRSSNFAEIGAAFPSLPVICFHGGSPWEVHPKVRARSISDFI